MLPPASIPDHELLAPIGRGSYGEVWLARNVTGARRAVKIVRRDAFADARPYEREFEAIQRYEPVSRSADGLVHVLHVGRAADDAYFYYVMELADAIEGDDYAPRTLRAEIRRRGALPPDQCIAVALALARALAALHHAGLVHRDIKPSNIIFVQGAPKLADIGLVSESGESHSFVGTAGYIPPEGAGAPAADLYSLGMVFYEMSTGQALARFPEVPREWLAAGRAEMEFFEIVARACESDPARRYRSAEELSTELALLEGGRSIRQRRAWESRRKVFRRVALAGAALALLALVASLGAWWRGGRKPVVAPIERVRAAVRAMQRDEALAAIADAARGMRSDDALRTLMLTALALPGGNETPRISRRLRLAAREPRSVEFHAAGRLIAVAANDGARLFDASSGAELAFLPQPRTTFADFEPGGGALLVSAVRSADDAPGGLWRRALRMEPPGAWRVARPEAIGQPGPFGRFASSADASVLVASTGEPPVVVTFPRDGAPVRMEQSTGGRAPAITRDGRRAAASRQSRGGVSVWNTAGGRAVLTLPTNGECAVAFSPDGAWLATSDKAEVARWQVPGGVAGWRTRKDADAFVTGGLVWSEDGAQLAALVAPSRVALLDAATGTVRARFEAPDAPPVSALALSPDGATLAVACANGGVFLWHLRATRAALARVGLDWVAAESAAFAPGGAVRVVVE